MVAALGSGGSTGIRALKNTPARVPVNRPARITIITSVQVKPKTVLRRAIVPLLLRSNLFNYNIKSKKKLDQMISRIITGNNRLLFLKTAGTIDILKRRGEYHAGKPVKKKKGIQKDFLFAGPQILSQNTSFPFINTHRVFLCRAPVASRPA